MAVMVLAAICRVRGTENCLGDDAPQSGQASDASDSAKGRKASNAP